MVLFDINHARGRVSKFSQGVCSGVMQISDYCFILMFAVRPKRVKFGVGFF
jgi:hypothetical protein